MQSINKFLINNHVKKDDTMYTLLPHIEEYADTYAGQSFTEKDFEEAVRYIEIFLGLKPNEKFDPDRTDIIEILSNYYNTYSKHRYNDILKDHFLILETVKTFLSYKLQYEVYDFIVYCCIKEIKYK